MTEKTVGLGVIGCGGFARFALEQFTQVPGVRVAAVCDVFLPAAEKTAEQFGAQVISEPEELSARPDVDLVYIATPPFLHHPFGLRALQSKKHVICEKPLAVTLEQADEMIDEARRHNLALAANLMQRYNPLYAAVKTLIETRLLGEFLHGYFENYATDEGLGPSHWFWDREKSGGIFVEHGVHFFDMFEGWLGPGRVVSAQRSLRPESGVEEQVQCVVRYGETVCVNFYHGFHQPGRTDRQEMRFLFERGDLTLFEWVPTRGRIRAVTDEESTKALCELFPDSELNVIETYGGDDRACKGRFKEIDAGQRIELTFGEGVAKMKLYAELLRAMLEDQLAWIRDNSHTRRISEENGRSSLAYALDADRLARSGDAAKAGAKAI